MVVILRVFPPQMAATPATSGARLCSGVLNQVRQEKLFVCLVGRHKPKIQAVETKCSNKNRFIPLINCYFGRSIDSTSYPMISFYAIQNT